MQPFFITDCHNALFRNFNDSLLENVAFYQANDLFLIESERLLNSNFGTWRVSMEVSLGNPAVYRLLHYFKFWVRSFSCLLMTNRYEKGTLNRHRFFTKNTINYVLYSYPRSV